MIWILLFIIGYVIISRLDAKLAEPNRDYREFRKNYNILISYFSNHMTIVSTSENKIVLGNLANRVIILEKLGKVIVRMEFGLFPSFNKEWKFPNNYSQILMIEEINKYCEKCLNKV